MSKQVSPWLIEKYYSALLSSDIYYLKLQNTSFIDIIKSLTKIVLNNPKILLFSKTYYHLLIMVIPNFLLNRVRKKRNSKKLVSF